MAYRHPDPQTWLDWLANLSKWPKEVQDLGQEYAGCTCYKMPHGEHVWIQAYDWKLSTPPQLWVTVLQGRDSRYPGLAHSKVPVEKLTHCDCGKWGTPTKEQGEQSQARYIELLSEMKQQAVLH
jgi:hypothetical protein